MKKLFLSLLSTGSFNDPAMLVYEDKVESYLKITGNHIRYQVELIFSGNELVARGVHIQAQSVEDNQLEFNFSISFWSELGLGISIINPHEEYLNNFDVIFLSHLHVFLMKIIQTTPFIQFLFPFHPLLQPDLYNSVLVE